MLAQAIGHLGIVLGALAALRNKKRGGQPQIVRGRQSRRVGHVGDDDSNFGIRQDAPRGSTRR